MGKLKFYITIAACLLVTVTGIIQNAPIIGLSIRLIITIIVFYILGGLTEAYLKKKVFYSDITDDNGSLTDEPADEGIE